MRVALCLRAANAAGFTRLLWFSGDNSRGGYQDSSQSVEWEHQKFMLITTEEQGCLLVLPAQRNTLRYVCPLKGTLKQACAPEGA